MRRLALVAVFALLAGCGDDEPEPPLIVPLLERNGSTQSGDAVLTAVGESRTRIELAIGSGGDEPQPVRIYRGTCERFGPKPAYVLDDVVGGDSITELDVPLDELQDGDLAINVHESPGVMRVNVACGEIR